MANNAISAVGIKRLWYCDPTKITADLTKDAFNTLMGGGDLSEVKNIHQDTWSIEEGEVSQDSYKNQLTGTVYRRGTKTLGDLTFKWTIGQYDYKLKADFLGGMAITADGNPISAANPAIGWKRQRGIPDDMYKSLIAYTEDKQFCVLPYASITANEANTDKAIGLAITGLAMEPKVDGVSPEYWFDNEDGAITVPA